MFLRISVRLILREDDTACLFRPGMAHYLKQTGKGKYDALILLTGVTLSGFMDKPFLYVLWEESCLCRI